MVLFIKILRDIDFNNTINININTALQLIFTFSISFPILSLSHRIIFYKNQKNWRTKYPILLESATYALNTINKAIKYKNSYYNKDISETPNVMLFALSQLTIYPIYQNTNYWNEYATTITLTTNFNDKTNEIIFNVPFPPKNCIYKEKSYKYSVSRDRYKTQYITDKDWNDIYKKILCSISLLCCNTIFQFDHQKMIDKIYINGFINCINDNTGKEEDCFLILLQTSREKLLSETIDLSSVNPVSCCKEYFDVKMEKNFINPSFKLKPYQFTE